jgi:hypothetical protein
MKNKLLTSFTLAVGLLLAGGAAHAATIYHAEQGMHTNGFMVDAAVGRNGNGNYETRAFVVFSVQEILANESLVLADLTTAEFDLTFATESATQLTTNTGDSYRAQYLGAYNNVTLDNSFWQQTINSASAVTAIDTGIADTASANQLITASSFTLSSVTEADSANDYVVFRITYDPTWQAAGTQQTLDGYTLSIVGGASNTGTVIMISGMSGWLVLIFGLFLWKNIHRKQDNK